MIKLPRICEVSIDFSTVCQLKCIECSTSKGITHKGIIGKGQLSFDNFKKFIDSNTQISRMEMSNWGEIFLNKDIGKIIEYAYRSNVILYCGNGTNFNNVDDTVLEFLVKFKVEFINISIDGVSQCTYEKYRVNGNIENVFKNIEKLNFYKKKYNSEYPKLSWQFIIFGHNEHELPLVKNLCKKYNMVFNPKLNYSNFSPVKDRDFVRKESGLGVADRQEFKNLYKREYKAPCYQCFSSPQINWDGKILGCCVNKWKEMGNVNSMTIDEWLNSKIYMKLVGVLFGKLDCDNSLPCYYCPNYNEIVKNPLTKEGLEKYAKYKPLALKNISNNDSTK